MKNNNALININRERLSIYKKHLEKSAFTFSETLMSSGDTLIEVESDSPEKAMRINESIMAAEIECARAGLNNGSEKA